ncbi:hypothetical protein [Nocardia asteroides]
MDIDLTCPTCHQLDQVQNVPAICSGGVSTGVGHTTHAGVGFTTAGLVPVFATSRITHTRSTALARSLARDPGLESTARRTRWAILLFLPAALMLAFAVADLAADGQEPIYVRVLGGIFFVGGWSVPGLLVMLSIWGAKRRNRAVVAGLPAADRLWRSAFYCHRCGHVYWPVPPAPTVPARVALTPPNFRWAVWSAGGYARL